MKVGDYVTANDAFYLYWYSEPFSVKVKEVDEASGIVYLEEFVETYSKGMPGGREHDNFFHKCYLKVDIKKGREEKLKKLASL